MEFSCESGHLSHLTQVGIVPQYDETPFKTTNKHIFYNDYCGKPEYLPKIKDINCTEELIDIDKINEDWKLC